MHDRVPAYPCNPAAVSEQPIQPHPQRCSRRCGGGCVHGFSRQVQVGFLKTVRPCTVAVSLSHSGALQSRVARRRGISSPAGSLLEAHARLVTEGERHDGVRVLLQVGTVVIMLSLLVCGFLLNGSMLPPAIGALHWLSYFAQAYEMLVTTEFHRNPAAFFFTAPVDTLPVLRVTGDGVLRQFGYQASRFLPNLAALCVLGTLCGVITYVALLLTHPVARAQCALVLRSWGLLDVQRRALGLMRLAVPARFRVEGASGSGSGHDAAVASPDASTTQPLLSTIRHAHLLPPGPWLSALHGSPGSHGDMSARPRVHVHACGDTGEGWGPGG